MKKIIIYSIAFIFVFFSCKKKQELPQPEITDPHFYVNCAMDGQPLNIVAGDDNYYMNSSWYRQDSNNVYVYKANLAKQVGSGYQVTILINDIRATAANAMMNVDSTLSLGQHLYNDQNTSGLTQNIGFKAVKKADGVSSYSWSATDGIDPVVNSASLADDFSYPFDVGKTYSVTLNYDDGVGNCNKSFTNVFKAGSKLQTAIIAGKDPFAYPEFKYNFSYSPVPPNVKCLWEFEDKTSYPSPTVNDKVFIQGSTSIVKLTLTDKSTNETCVSYYQLNATNGSVCDANYTANFPSVQNIRLYSSVTLLLTDPNGVVYSSQNLIQPQSSDFKILSVSNYNTNENGQPTKRLQVSFNCIVKNGSKEINLKNGEAMIAVAYK